MTKEPQSWSVTIIRLSCFFDLFLFAGLSIPVLSDYYFYSFRSLHDLYELEGEFPNLAPFHMMLANLLGLLTVGWAACRLSAPSANNVKLDVVLRLAVVFVISYYVAFENISEVLWFFVVSELSLASVLTLTLMLRVNLVKSG